MVMLFCLYMFYFRLVVLSSYNWYTPPPCQDCSFLKVSNSTVVLFGGSNERYYSDELYTLDLNNMVRNM